MLFRSVALDLELQVIDIDAAAVSPALKSRYDLEVPVLALADQELPRVSPRLAGEGLFNWLQRRLPNPLGPP